MRNLDWGHDQKDQDWGIIDTASRIIGAGEILRNATVCFSIGFALGWRIVTDR